LAPILNDGALPFPIGFLSDDKLDEVWLRPLAWYESKPDAFPE